jgi:tetratricopeptide (TPR) repeat protein
VNPNEFQRASDVFLRARALPAGERAAYLDAACGADAGLRREVERLLAAADLPTPFRTLADELRPVGEGLATVAAADLGSPPAAADSAAIGRSPVASGDRIAGGRYKLLEQIGEGGFGVVYMAEQEHPIRRRVALKVIKLGMDTRQVVARFEAERQALALMDHPNIARVLDAGATDGGRPFFVMELVRGVPVTDYCDAHQLPLADRLGLFAQVCRAVQHAHQKGIIHRDLKPSNVLVATADGRPVPKVIDFGIAKATQSRLTERTLFTEFRQMVGTPEYMSPEQADAGGGVDVDTRSDVYSLGVLLYELLTGTTPFAAAELRSKAYGEIQRIIREVDPPRPSTRVGALPGETLAGVAARRRTDGGRLGRAVRGELDWVVMRCLEKDRDRRYETAAALADDVRRYLADEPVAAAAPGALYRARKWARRNRGLLAAGGAVAAALLLGIAGTTAGLVRAGAERDQAVRAREGEADQARAARAAQATAEAARGQAEKARGSAEAAARFLEEMLSAGNPDRARQRMSLEDVLNQAARRLDAGTLAAQPEVEARVRKTLGITCEKLAMLEPALAHHRRSVELRRRLGDDGPLSASLADLAWLYMSLDRAAEGLAAIDECVDISRRLVRDGKVHEVDILNSVNIQALLLGKVGRTADAERVMTEYLDLNRKHRGDEDASISIGLGNLSNMRSAQGDAAGAEALARRSMHLTRVTMDHGHPHARAALLGLIGKVNSRGDTATAEAHLRVWLATFHASLPAEHPESKWPVKLLGDILRAKGEAAAAAALPGFLEGRMSEEQCRAQYDRAVALRPDDPLVYTPRAVFHQRHRRFREAAADYERAGDLAADDPASYFWMCRAAHFYFEAGDTTGYRRVCDAMLARHADRPPSVPAVGRIARACLIAPASPDVVTRVAALLSKGRDVGPYDWMRPFMHLARGMALLRAGEYDRAAAVLRQVREGASAPMWGTALVYAAVAEHRAGRPAAARETFADAVRAYDGMGARTASGPVPEAADQWAINRAARREAEALLGPIPATQPTPPARRPAAGHPPTRPAARAVARPAIVRA